MTSLPETDASVRPPFDPSRLLGLLLPNIFDASCAMTSRQRLVAAAVLLSDEIRWSDDGVGGACGEAHFTVAQLVEKTALTDALVSAALVSAEDPEDEFREGVLRALGVAVAWHRKPGRPRLFAALLSAPRSSARARAESAWGISR